MKNNLKIPRIPMWLFKKFIPSSDHDEFISSMAEVYGGIYNSKGNRAAGRWFWLQLFKSLPKFISACFSGGMGMMKNYCLTAVRSILRKRGYSSIKIFGLSLGIASCILIFLWVRDEKGINQFHENINRLHRVDIEIGAPGQTRISPVTAGPAVFELKNKIPEIENATRLFRVQNVLIKKETVAAYESNIYAADPSIFDMFSFPLEKGDPAKALSEPGSIVISERIATKYFGQHDALGKTLSINSETDFVVTGIVKNIPLNSTIRFDILFPFSYISKIWENVDTEWGNISFPTYVLLHRDAVRKNVDLKIQNMIKDHLPDAEIIQFLAPFKEIYLYNHTSGGRTAGPMAGVTIFSLVAIFILLIACVNFMNLSTARAAERAKEIGVRKISGANKKGMIVQFISEAFVMVIFSLISALLLVQLVLSPFNRITQKSLSLSLLIQPDVILGICMILIITSLAAGFYPAFVLSSFKPVVILKGGWENGRRRSKLRKSLVIFQFALSVALILCTVTVYKQLNFIKNKNLGWDRDQLLGISLRGDTGKKLDAIKNELLSSPQVQWVSASRYTPLYVGSHSSKLDWDGKNPEGRYNFAVNSVSYDYFRTLQVEMFEGRSFSKEITTDDQSAFVINEEAMKQMGLTSAVGKRFSLWGHEGTIIGVSKNYHFQSVRQKIEPLVHVMTQRRLSYLLVRLRAGHVKEGISHLEKSWTRVMSGYPLEFTFFDEAFQGIYDNEKRMGQLLGYFSSMAICIACLGLFSLASYTAQKKSREIGIRKVLGASVTGISRTLCWEFLLLVLIANLLAWPVAYYFIHSWLSQFAYRIAVPGTMFVLFGMLTMAVALISVAYQSITAAGKNPVDTIRNN